jgi:chloramphenicol-sensitive protein RarD
MFSSAHLSAIVAFSLWGLFPIYWKFFAEVATWDLFAHRLMWSFFTLLLIILFKKKIPLITEIWRDKRKAILLVLSAGLISSNWLLYIYAVNTGRILEASMGYFLNPLFNVLMGRILLKESIRATQWPAIVLALFAIVLIGVQSNIEQIPYIALILSVTFAMYGLIRKVVHVGALEGLFFETCVVIIPTMVAWHYQSTTPMTIASQVPAWKLFVLSLSGLVTCLPLILFAYAARRLPLTTLGFIQYLSPSFKFICGLLIFHEALAPERLYGFIIIWIALAWYSVESLVIRKKNLIRHQ